MMRTMERRDYTQIKILIMKRLEHGPVAIYSRRLGSLRLEIGTDYNTFRRALDDLISSGLVEVQTVEYGRYRCRMLRLSDLGRGVLPSAAKLIPR